MIKLKFDARRNLIEMYRDKNIIASFDSQDFGNLIREIKEILKKTSPKLTRKLERKTERKNLINNLKILIAINAINFWRYFKSLFNLK